MAAREEMSGEFGSVRRRMDTPPYRIFAILGVLILGLAGCSEKTDEKPTAPVAPAKVPAERSAPATNKVSLAEVFPGATTNELAHIQACQDAIDDGRDAIAMRHARELMDSTNAEVRLQAVEAFGWIGKYAVKELAELMVDADEHVRSEALRHWEMAFDEISSEALKVQEIERAADLLKDQSSLEAVMMKLAGLEDYNAVKTLCGIITSTNAAPVATEVAREEYASLTGEPFLDAKRAEQVAAILKNQSEGISPEPPKEQISTKNQVGPRDTRDQGKEQK